jgi:hypothetical protein
MTVPIVSESIRPEQDCIRDTAISDRVYQAVAGLIMSDGVTFRDYAKEGRNRSDQV